VPSDDSDSIQSALEALVAREPVPAATCLPRRPGQKEVRYAHLFSGVDVHEQIDTPVGASITSAERIAALEELTNGLRNEVSELRAQLEAFRRQFE
jgi:uncharacterized protein YceH (UPF0502 family)